MKLTVVTDIFDRPAGAMCLSSKIQGVTDIDRFSLKEICGRPDLTGEHLHRFLFSDGGIDNAAAALRDLTDEISFGLGYSAGGTALWRAAAKGMPLKGLFCISSTRLRDEQAIQIPNHVFYGAQDPKRPAEEWLSVVPESHTVFEDSGHDYYLEPTSYGASATCRQIASELAR